MQLLELFCGDIQASTHLSWLDSGNHFNNVADQVSMFPPRQIKVAAKFADGRYLIACSTEEGPYAYLGYPEAMQALKVQAYQVFESGKTFDITTSIGNLHFDSEPEKLVFEWFETEQDGDSYEIKKAIDKRRIGWADMLEDVNIDRKPRSHL